LALCLIGFRGYAATPVWGFLTGVLLGLGCGLRYATAVVVSSILAWLLLVARAPLRQVGWVLMGIAPALALGLAVDRWGYGEWTLPLWNYVLRNLGEDRAAVEFGSLPWYGYSFLLARGPFAPLNLLLAGTVVVAWVRHPRHLLTWATASVALVHCVIPHKELRFLFPIAMLSPLLLTLAVEGTRWRRWARVLAGGVVALDLVALAALCVLPAQPQVAFQRFVARRFPAGLSSFVATPSSPWVRDKLTLHFYGPPPPGLRTWPGAPALVAAGVVRLNLVASSWDGPPATAPYECRPLYRSVPDWLSRHGWPPAGGRPPAAWDLFRCTTAHRSADGRP
jgi:hypothetical protein